MSNIAELLRVSPDEVKKALCHRVIAVRGEVMEKRHTDSEAGFGRDAFAKVINSPRGSLQLFWFSLPLYYFEAIYNSNIASKGTIFYGVVMFLRVLALQSK